MKNKHYNIACVLLLLLQFTGCQPEEEEVDSDLVKSPNESNGNPGSTKNYALSSDSKKFYYTTQSLDREPADDVDSHVYPAAATPVIIDAAAVTTLASLTQVAQSYTGFTAAASVGSSILTTAIDSTDSTRSASIKLLEEPTSCSSDVVPLTCEVDLVNTEQLNLTDIDMSGVTNDTENFKVKLNDGEATVPIAHHKISVPQAFQNGGTLLEAVSSSNKIFFSTSQALGGGSFTNSVHITDINTKSARWIFKPNPNLTHGDRIKNLAALGDNFYFTASDSLVDFDLFKYEPATDTLSRLSSETDLREAGLFVKFNNHLYFTATRDGHAHKKLFKIDTSGLITQLTNLCANTDDVLNEMIATSKGLYAQLADPNGCGSNSRIIARINADDSIQELTYASSYQTESYMGSVIEVEDDVYFAAGSTSGFYIFKDNLDGTIDPINRYHPTEKFVYANGALYWKAYQFSNYHIMKYKLSDQSLTKLSIGNQTLLYDYFTVGDRAYVFAKQNDDRKKLFRMNDNDTLQKVASINTPAFDDEFISPQFYKGELYFLGLKNGVGNKVYKFSADEQIVQLSDFRPGGSDADKFHFHAKSTDIGIIFSSFGLEVSGIFIIE